MSPEALRDFQFERASQMLAWATEATTFYPRFYGARNVDCADVRSWDDWEALPILDLSIVKDHAADFATAEATPRNVRDAKTGGSTGQPLRTMHDARVPTLALAWRMYSWWTVRPWVTISRA